MTNRTVRTRQKQTRKSAQPVNMITKADLLDMVMESELQADIRRFANQLGWECYHTHNSQLSDPGFPDLVLVRPPRIIFAELKRQSGKVSPAQHHWLGLLQQCPIVESYLWYPKDINDIVAILSKSDLSLFSETAAKGDKQWA
jgi:hypothetical protein